MIKASWMITTLAIVALLAGTVYDNDNFLQSSVLLTAMAMLASRIEDLGEKIDGLR